MKIGEVARRSGVSARMLRHYDALGLVRPSGRTVAGYREYADTDLRRIFHVESLRTLGLSLKEIGRALDDPGFTPSALVDDLIAQTQQTIETQTTLLARLRQVAAAEPRAWDEVLDVVSLLRRLAAPSTGERQHAALDAVGAAPGVVLADALLREDNLNVAGALRWALVQDDATAGDLGDAVRVLEQALESPDQLVRRRAAETLAEFPGDAALRAALGHHDPTVRGVVAIELGARGDTVAVPELIAMILRGDRDVPAAEALAVIALGPEREQGIIADLMSAFAGSGEYSVRQRVVQALAEFAGPAATAALDALRGDADERIARTAEYVLRVRSGAGTTER
ncbi:Transcriptional regulator, MerR family OS=Tsukamurella paurometabola (strain ATCC 8368 / DSM/ CCUG 35730 / CIP 100753 / JCM 10117 / KCTC 9821 / NBRC 16120/ NCIMB 702349 / NCTC 13040) OX=521096 GN=Tpau_2451 PE=4 SV=1 [Tsukamurella paurometabola]|uniref:Transcriptional regulator, MerR family n=1 Tax=Tsukamurella paurometabola (strain ATCC 8368 / DSM 20162 / CCUG 35730 / CIP 100753 / JCM 10117 / KCTC 9821 / NBRC 16120 / NCIMB 702349 / NCTC 13040) TaxID=521096 RepID=D5UR67_TSUPD|nr:HEAT repeat domain-containing protein [Tsukamurella paurometabola]ADG79056.1 transcriptional regulator, MerR family [Tsukamurella paurometabola DSM 20162]SUP33920.1 Multidrug transporter activation protein [Tsukamurella paurometabola]